MSLRTEVAALMRKVASEIVVPRFRHLAAGDISEKSPGEIVTCVDVAAERHLTRGLSAILPEARVIGEEACAHEPELLGQTGKGLVWLVDPLDGTANYAAGRAPFGMMVALVADGEVQMGWILDALEGRLCFAERGRGAWCDDARVTASTSGAARPVAALGTHFLSAPARERVHAAAAPHLDRVAVPMCAAESYPRLVMGADDIALFQRALPWDHAAGALFVTEAGGRITHWDGSDYRVGGSDGGASRGILAAASADLWDTAAHVLLGPATGLGAHLATPLTRAA